MGMKHKQRRPHSGLTCAMTMGLMACLWPGSASAAVQIPAAAEVDNVRASFDIPPQALASAVVAFAEQSGVQVFFDRSTLAGLQSPGLKGQHTVPEALALLLEGLPVKYQMLGQQQLNLERLPDVAAAMQLDSTHVQGLSDRDKVFEVPRSVSTIDREQMDRHPVRNVADLLEETEGVYSAVSQRDPGLSVNIRGVQDYGRVNMNIDGMRQNYSQMGHQQRNGTMYIDPELLGASTSTRAVPAARAVRACSAAWPPSAPWKCTTCSNRARTSAAAFAPAMAWAAKVTACTSPAAARSVCATRRMTWSPLTANGTRGVLWRAQWHRQLERRDRIPGGLSGSGQAVAQGQG